MEQKTTRWTAASLFLAALMVAGPAQAAYSGSARVRHVAVSAATNTVQVYFDGLNFSTGCALKFKAAASLSTITGEKLLDVALAAQTSGQSVHLTVDLDTCTAGMPSLTYLRLVP